MATKDKEAGNDEKREAGVLGGACGSTGEQRLVDGAVLPGAGLSTVSLAYWKRRLGEAGVAAAPRWLPVVLEAERSSGVVVQVGAGIRLELQPGFDPVVLQQAVAALR